MTTEYGDFLSDVGSDVEAGFKISFLYNGQLGVITDDNGLYYMRSRYYNPEIKRFINQDILTGNICNSASLNRYSYVEGNPVSYTDPFGLSPFKTLHQQLHKLMFIPGIGKYFALTDAFLYIMEGDWGNAFTSGLFVIPGGQYVFGAIAAYKIIGMYVDEFTNDGKKNDQLVQGFLSGLDEYYGFSDMSAGEIIFWVVVIGTTNAYAYSEAQLAKAVEAADFQIRNELYAKLEPDIDLNYTGGVSSPEKIATIGKGGSKTPDINTGAGYGASDPPVRIDGEWTINDMKQALLGHSPRGLGNPDIHHGEQMPGGSLHEVLPNQHRNNSALHPNLYNQGVTNEMRVSDRQLHWWYRAREQGADELLPDWIYDD